VIALSLAASLTLSDQIKSPTPDRETSCLYDPDHPSCENVYLGYWWGNFWVPGMIDNMTWYTPAPDHIVGKAVFYAPYMMRATAEYRGLDLDGYLDGVSLMSPADIGQTVWIKRPGEEWEGPFLVVDCARRSDMYGVIVHNEEVVEVGFRTAERWKMVRRTQEGWVTLLWNIEGVEIYKGPRAPQEPSQAIVYTDWFLERVSFTYRWQSPPRFTGRPLFFKQPNQYIGLYLAN
jgi:hypothetical protein